MLIAHSGRGIISSTSVGRYMWIYYLSQPIRKGTTKMLDKDCLVNCTVLPMKNHIIL